MRIPFILLLLGLFCSSCSITRSHRAKTFRVIAFYTAKDDQAHISFVHEANKWFGKMSEQFDFRYDLTDNWSNLNDAFLARYQVVVFLDTRPEAPGQREAFTNYMQQGGGWMGFHFAAFALDNSAYPDDWPWYQNKFLGCGAYKSNTWRPTAAILRVESSNHPVAMGIPYKFKSSPNEWYRWEKDLKKNSDIDILLSIDPESFPLGTGPKPHEIWHSGYYPVVWTNKKYNMVYFNMGHNDIDYENASNAELSFTFENAVQNKLILNALFWLGNR